MKKSGFFEKLPKNNQNRTKMGFSGKIFFRGP